MRVSVRVSRVAKAIDQCLLLFVNNNKFFGKKATLITSRLQAFQRDFHYADAWKKACFRQIKLCAVSLPCGVIAAKPAKLSIGFVYANCTTQQYSKYSVIFLSSSIFCQSVTLAWTWKNTSAKCGIFFPRLNYESTWPSVLRWRAWISPEGIVRFSHTFMASEQKYYY